MISYKTEDYVKMDLLRFTTAGSVDDGKSTLIGRLLYDTKSIFEDQLASIEEKKVNEDDTGINLAYLTDGLRSEREQGITIDVAYRYFATPKRKFIIADTPGHIQYTRNMVTGASTAELAIILIDARNGVLTQSKRHGFLSSLLQIKHMIVCVNKMDLVDYQQGRFEEITKEYREFCQKLDIQDLHFIPISALKGDNVVEKSTNMPWYTGRTLLDTLENVQTLADRNLVDFRFPVQTVIRPHQNFRGYAGKIVSGTIQVGEKVAILPSGQTSRIKGIVQYNTERQSAFAGESVILTLEDELDISRGDMIVRTGNLPIVANKFTAMLCWMSKQTMQPGKQYILNHTTQSVRSFVSQIDYRIDVDTMHRSDATGFQLNDIGRVELTTSKPIFFDRYDTNRACGGFILIDPDDFTTVGAGMIRGITNTVESVAPQAKQKAVSPNVTREASVISPQQWQQRNGHKAAVVWFTGLSGSGKSTIARQCVQHLFDSRHQVMLLDGDTVRHGLCGDLGFSAEDRSENIRRVAHTAQLFMEQGNIVICTFISPFEKDREFVRQLVGPDHFVEVFVQCDIETCKKRDPKGLYAKALAGTISDFTGISSEYQQPKNPDIILDSEVFSVEQSVLKVADYLNQMKITRE